MLMSVTVFELLCKI